MYNRFAGGRERAVRALELAFHEPENSAAADAVWVAELEGQLGAAMAAFPVEEALPRSGAGRRRSGSTGSADARRRARRPPPST
jgi:hypothetical protein